MNLAIATSDGALVAGHLARASAFVVLQIEDGKVTSREVRDRASDKCGHHATFVQLLQGCEAVICGGIGQGAFDSLATNGIWPLVTARPFSIEGAVAEFVAGTLPVTDERVCLCG